MAWSNNKISYSKIVTNLSTGTSAASLDGALRTSFNHFYNAIKGTLAVTSCLEIFPFDSLWGQHGLDKVIQRFHLFEIWRNWVPSELFNFWLASNFLCWLVKLLIMKTNLMFSWLMNQMNKWVFSFPFFWRFFLLFFSISTFSNSDLKVELFIFLSFFLCLSLLQSSQTIFLSLHMNLQLCHFLSPLSHYLSLL